MKLTFEDTLFIRKREGFSLRAYPDPVSGDKPYTIAWGLTGDWVIPGLIITQDEAKIKFMERIDDFCSKLDKVFTRKPTKNQYIAMLSLTYNIGFPRFASSTLLKKFNKGQISAADEFLKWNRANGSINKNILARRKLEQDLFLS